MNHLKELDTTHISCMQQCEVIARRLLTSTRLHYARLPVVPLREPVASALCGGLKPAISFVGG